MRSLTPGKRRFQRMLHPTAFPHWKEEVSMIFNPSGTVTAVMEGNNVQSPCAIPCIVV